MGSSKLTLNAKTITFVTIMATLAAGAPAAAAAEAPCNQWLPKKREVRGQSIGPSACAFLDVEAKIDGVAVRRIEIGLDGTVDGFVTEGTGDYSDYLTNAPDLVFGNSADPGPVLHAIATYERAKGAAISLVFPSTASAWNGKLWVSAHGRGRSVKSGNLKPWDRNLDPADPIADLSRYDRLWLAKGYALAKTHRTTEEGVGEIRAVLEDGRVSMNKAFNDSARYVMDFALVAENALRERLGRAPSRMFFYGHSAGARIGRGLNYTPGLNMRDNGQTFFSGILADDAAAGTWLPVVMRGGKDILFATPQDRRAFVPQLEISHQMYNNVWETGAKLPWTSISYLENKRNNARLIREKGLGERHRVYEVRGISHSGGEGMLTGERGDVKILQLAHAMDRFIDLLDAWVEKNVAPPPSRSDWAPLGDADGDGTIENPALAFPEIACPLGVYFPFPPGLREGMAQTGWAPFSGRGLEPRDGRGEFVDMNHNGVWDLRESASDAWKRLGLLGRGEALTREKYTGCVNQAAERMVREGFFSAATAARYGAEAQAATLP